MSNSLASQLQAIRSIALTDSAPQKRPFTRPSILFDPKEAADKSTESIYTIAAQGNFIFHYFYLFIFVIFHKLNEFDC